MSHATETTPVPAAHNPADFLDRQVHAPSMEATCHNLDQHNPSPEIDSIFEFMGVEIEQLPDSPRKQRLSTLLIAAVESNRHEGNQHLAISGDVDQAITDLRRITAGGPAIKRPNVHQLTALLRRPLTLLADPAGRTQAQLDQAGTEIDRLFQQHGKRLFAATVIHNLGKAKARVLIERCGQ